MTNPSRASHALLATSALLIPFRPTRRGPLMRPATRKGVAVLSAVTTTAIAAALVLGGGLTGRDTARAATGPALSVDQTVDRHPISPYIYGMNFTDEALA